MFDFRSRLVVMKKQINYQMLNEGDSFFVALDKASSKQNLQILNQDDSLVLHLDPFGPSSQNVYIDTILCAQT